MKTILEKKRIAFENIYIEANIDRNKDQANKVTKIALHYTVVGQQLNLSLVQKSLNIAMKNCGMIESVKGSIEVIETIEVKEKLMLYI